MGKFNQKSFNDKVFAQSVENAPNLKRNELAKSNAVGFNEDARDALKKQGGSLYAIVSYFGNISEDTSQNNDGNTDIATSTTSSFEQGFVTASRMDSWTEKSFTKNITAGVDFLANVAKQISIYKYGVKQKMILAMLEGIYSMAQDDTTTAGIAATEFITNHTFDITAEDDGKVGAATLNNAVGIACGDNEEIFTLCLMHSAVATNLKNLELLEFLTHTDKDGITRNLPIGSWNGRIVLIDDGMPTINYVLSTDTAANSSKTYYSLADGKYTAVSSATTPVTNGYYEKLDATEYVTYVLGEGSIILDDIGDANPYELDRDPKVNGGQDTIFVRDRFICGVEGISFEKPSTLTTSASNTDLSTGANWNVINDGTNSISHKAIPICRIISKG